MKYQLLFAIVTIVMLPMANLVICQTVGNIIEVSTTRYNMTIGNKMDYTLKVSSRGWGKNIDCMIAPKTASNHPGFYSRSEMQNKKLICTYDIETFRIDSQQSVQHLHNRLTILQKDEHRVLERLKNMLLFRIGVQLGRNSENKIIKYSSDLFYLIDNLENNINKYNNIVEDLKKCETALCILGIMDIEATDELKQKAFSNVIQDIEHALNAREGTIEASLKAIALYFENVQELVMEVARLKSHYIDEHNNRLTIYRDVLMDKMFPKKHTYKAGSIYATEPSFTTYSTNLIFSFLPLSYGPKLNDHLKSPKETIFKDFDKDGDLDWGDGLWNSTFGTSLLYSLSPEMYFNRNFYSRIYVGGAYYNTGYRITGGHTYSPRFFSEFPEDQDTFSLSSPAILQHKRLSADIVWRWYIRNGVILDLHGGYAMHYGVLNLKNSKPSTGVEWAQTRISFTDKVYQPFYGIRIGFGRNEFHTSTHVMGGIQFFNVQNSQIVSM